MEKLAQTQWKEGMAFEAQANGHTIMMDAADASGGKNLGPRSKPLLLVALAGCTSMDVVSMLRKMKVTPDDFKVETYAESSGEHPKYYEKIKVKYIFKGENLDRKKIEKAVNLSQDKYCAVSYMLGKAAQITHEIEILDR